MSPNREDLTGFDRMVACMVMDLNISYKDAMEMSLEESQHFINICALYSEEKMKKMKENKPNNNQKYPDPFAIDEGIHGSMSVQFPFDEEALNE